MAFVVDASVILAWAFEEEYPTAEMMLEQVRTEVMIVPDLWWFELWNGLVIGERRARITEQRTARFLHDISRIAVRRDRAPNEVAILTLARRHRLTVDDAAYLEVAARRSVPLATLDAALSRAARGEAVPLIGDSAESSSAGD